MANPLDWPPDSALGEASHTASPDAAPTIVVVDDDARVRGLFAAILRAAGFAVVEAGTGAEALDAMAARPALVVLDVHLPDMDGFEVCRRIRAVPDTARIPVLYVSGVYREAGDRVRGLDSGGDGYLIQPVGSSELVAYVRALLRLSRAEGALRVSEARRLVAEALADVAQLQTESLDPAAVGQRLVERIQRLFRAAVVTLLGADAASGGLRGIATAGDVGPMAGEPLVFPRGTGLVGVAVAERRAIASADVLTDARVTLTLEMRAWIETAPFRAVLAVPLIVRGRVVGALAIGDRAGRAFAPDEIRLAQTFAHQGSLALENAALFRQAKERAERLRSLSALTGLIARASTRHEVFTAIASAGTALLGATLARVWLVGRDARTLRLEASAGREDRARSETLEVASGIGVVGGVFARQRPEYLEDVQNDPRWLNRRFAREAGLHAGAFIPLRVGSDGVGVLSLLFAERRPFSAEDRELAQLLADHAAIAIQNARLFTDATQRQHEAEALADVTRLLSRSLDLVVVARQIEESLRRLLDTTSAAVYVREPASGDMVALVTSSTPDAGFPWSAVLPAGAGVFALALREQRPVAIPDVLADPRVSYPAEARARLESSPHRAVLAVSLIVQDRIIGGLAVGDRAGRHFDERQIELAERFAHAAAVAIENARLFGEAKSARDFLHSVTEHSADGIFATDNEARLTYCNPAMLRIVGREMSELLGDTLWAHVPEGTALGRSLMERLRQEPDGQHVDTALRTAHGRDVDVALSLSLRGADGAPEGMVGLVQDVSEQRRAEAVLRESEARYRSLVETSIQGICIHQDFIIRFANAAMARILDVAAPSELVGRSMNDFVAPHERARLEGYRTARLRGAPAPDRYEYEGLRADGSPMWGECLVSVVPWQGRPGILITCLDITERKRAEEALRQAQKVEAIGRLAGGVAHDFNNLLAVILGRIQLARDQLGPGAPLRKQLDLIERTAERGASLTRQLLAFSRKQVIAPQVLDLNAVLADVGPILRRLIGEDIDLSIMPAPAPAHIHADQAQIEQVIMNLVVNARDAMPSGGRVVIQADTARIDAPPPHPGARPGRYARLAVRDTGIGMDAAIRAHLFEPFFTTKGVGQGTGLGLATVHGIVTQAGGFIVVESAPGRGSTFEVYLPSSEAAVAAPPPKGAPRPPDRGSETILLVEDEQDLRTLMHEILGGYGYTVLTARHGGEALQIAEGHKGPIHLLLTDVVMPQLSGRELSEQLMRRRPDVKVLYVSGYTDDALSHHGVLEPGTMLLHKPFGADGLARAVRDVLDGLPGGVHGS